MILGLGLDLTQIQRSQQFLDRHGERFTRRILTSNETEFCARFGNSAERIAGCIAAKEAASKALGTGMSDGVHWKCFEITRERSGKPTLVLHGRAAELAAEMGVKRVSLSITHDAGMAAAVVIFEGD